MATVRNSGDLGVSPVQVAFYDGASQIGSTQTLPDLVSGYTATAQINWTVPAPAVVHNLVARVDPLDEVAEIDESNNQATLTTVLPDLLVDWAYTTWTTGVLTVTASLHNAGTSPVVAPSVLALRDGDVLSGTLLLTATVDIPLPAGQSETVILPLHHPGRILTGPHTGWLVADATELIAEADEGNNATLLGLNVSPNLTPSVGKPDGEGAFLVSLHNGGLITATDVLLEVRKDGIDGTLIQSQTITIVPPGEQVTFAVMAPLGHNTLFVHADPAGAIAELDESDNLAVREVEVFLCLYLPLVLR